MLWSRRVLLLLVVASLSSPCQAQVRLPIPPAADSPVDVLKLPTDARAARLLEAAREYVEARDWKTAVDALQRLLDREDDVLISVTTKGPDGREIRRVVGARGEARN